MKSQSDSPDILHFSHANGFPAGSYQTLLDQLAEHYDVRTIDRLGHQPQYPVTDNWAELEQELTHYFEQNYSRPVIAVGHSLGGLLSYMVARHRPDLIKGLIMLDAPVLTPMQAFGFRMLKRWNLADRVTPAGRTDGRRQHWSDQQEAMEYFSGKSLMKRFHPESLRNYVSAGTEYVNADDPEKGVRLRFDPDTEMKIYRTIPHNVRSDKPLAMPSAVIAGRNSDVFWPSNGARMKSKVGMKLCWLPGGHMFPLEHPHATADLILQLLKEML